MSANVPPWQRKESVTIIERAEDEKDAEDETEKPVKPVRPLTQELDMSSFLTVPKSLTASSSAETLSGKMSRFSKKTPF